MEKVLSESGIVFVCKNAPEGSEKELGMWPEGRPERGSGSEPVYLQGHRTYYNGRREGDVAITFQESERLARPPREDL